MANQKIRRDPDWNVQETGRTDGWQQGSQPNQSDTGKVQETRAEPDAFEPLTVT